MPLYPKRINDLLARLAQFLPVVLKDFHDGFTALSFHVEPEGTLLQ